MTATVKIDLNSPQAVSLVSYLETLPFARVKRTKPAPPCQYTIEELRESVRRAEEDIAAGRTYTMEQVRAIFARV